MNTQKASEDIVLEIIHICQSPKINVTPELYMKVANLLEQQKKEIESKYVCDKCKDSKVGSVCTKCWKTT